MLGFMAWLLGSKIGKYLVVALLVVSAILFVLLRVYSAGKMRERLKQREAATKALLERVKVDDEIRKMPSSDRFRELERWVRE